MQDAARLRFDADVDRPAPLGFQMRENLGEAAQIRRGGLKQGGCRLPAPGDRQRRDAAFHSGRQERVLDRDEIERVVEPLRIGPGRLVDPMLDDGLMKVAVGKAVERERHEADVAEPGGEVVEAGLPQAARCVRTQPETDAHRPIRRDEPLHLERVPFEVGPRRREVGARVNVGAIAGRDRHVRPRVPKVRCCVPWPRPCVAMSGASCSTMRMKLTVTHGHAKPWPWHTRRITQLHLTSPRLPAGEPRSGSRTP